MKKYINQTNSLKVVRFNDGTSQFLMRGQSFESDKKTIEVQEGVTVKENKPSRKSSSKSSESE